MMFKKSVAGITALICTVANSAFLQSPAVYAEGTDSYKMNVSVDFSGEKKEISPYIYGINEFSNSNLKNIKVNNVRQGGNRYTGYNWETNYSSAGEDWMNMNDTYFGSPEAGPAKAQKDFLAVCEKYNIPYRLTTLQMAGYVAGDKDGTVKEDETAPSKRWNKVEFRKNGELSLTPDLTDDTVYMDEFVNYLVKTYGDSTTSTGFQAYSLDNEPCLWNDTHPRLHPEEVTNKELVSKSIELAKVVKEIDPNAEVFGPAFWGMLPCINCGESGNGFTDSDWQAVKGDYFWYLDYYLKQMADAEKEYGKRLLDVVDVHYYSQDCATDEARLQSARSLYDPTYAENSWLQPWGAQYFPFITNIQKSIDKYYPGTKIAVSEYNLANISDEKNTGKSVVSAIAEADALGCFASNNVYFATYWGTLPECPYVCSAINLYTNYDGEGSSFGDTLLSTKTDDLSKSYAYASINGDNDSEVKMVISNKDSAKTESAEITLTGSASEYKSATVYAITQDNSDIHVIDVKNNLSGNKLTVELPPLSVAQVVLSTEKSDKEVYEAPDIQTKEVKYNFSELEKSKNGYLMIPIEDADHIKKVVINSTASCTSNSDWYGGGGGLCFNNLKLADGTTTWAQKSFMYGQGTSDTEILFDGTYNMPDPDNADASIEVEGTVLDKYMEFQDWWKSSTKDSTGADVSVTYNTITVVYEYNADEDAKQTTTTAKEEETTATTTVSSDTKAVYGDANEDSDVTIADAVLILQSIANPDTYKLTSQGKANADVADHGDGVTAKDALIIQQVEANQIKVSDLPLKAEN